jgi:hypothetical protein
MKQETKQKITQLLSQTTHENTQEMALQVKEILAADGTLTKDEQLKVLSQYVKQAAKKSDVQTVVDSYVALAKFICQKMVLKHVVALHAVADDGDIRLFAVTADAQTELLFDRYITTSTPHEYAMLEEIENLLAEGTSQNEVISALNAYGKERKKAKAEKQEPSAKVVKVAKNLVAFGKFFIAENEIENAKALVARYDDDILDLYVKTDDEELYVDLEELVGDDEKRHEMLNEIFDDSLYVKDIREAIKLVNSYQL